MIKYYLTPDAIAAKCKFQEPAQGDCGFDLYAARGYRIFAGDKETISTGLHVQIPEGFVGIIKDRSSMAIKGCHVLAGVVDSSYRGEIKVILRNFEFRLSINPGERIAQMIIVPYRTDYTQSVVSLEHLDQHGSRGYDGFGSTGV